MRAFPRAMILAVASLALAVPSAARAWCQAITPRRCTTDADCLAGQACASRQCAWRVPPTACEAPDFEHTFPLAWRRPCTSLSLSAAAPSSDLSRDEVLGVLERSIATWEAVRCEGERAPGIDLTLLAEPDECVRASHLPTQGNVHSVIFVREGWADEHLLDPRAFAVTLVWFGREGEIVDVDIQVNEERGPFAICPPEGCAGQVDLENTLTHEIGHYFGLAHSIGEPLSTMHASAEVGDTTRRTLEPDDVLGLCSIYPAGSLTETCEPEPLGGLDLDCRASTGCGCQAPGVPRGSATGALSSFGGALLGAVLLVRRRRP